MDWFQPQPVYRAKLLQLYKDEGLHGVGTSLLSLRGDRAIALAELQHRKGFFYFCELASGSRAALAYQNDYALLTPDNFNSLFINYETQHLDWLKYKKQAIEGKVAGRYVIHPRNYHTRGVAITLRCHKLITSLSLP